MPWVPAWLVVEQGHERATSRKGSKRCRPETGPQSLNAAEDGDFMAKSVAHEDQLERELEKIMLSCNADIAVSN
jgi:hypothetical protein